MGLFGSKYKDMLIPGCDVQQDESAPGRAVISCNAKKILGDVTLTGEKPIKLVVEDGKLFTLSDGGLGEPVVEEVISYVKRTLRPR